MSETFYIKKTAFDDNNFDLAQRETDSFIIGPGELNGPAGLARDSDLELYGFGSLKWGEGVDQNQYRLMESSACPAKVTGDFLVGTDVKDSNNDGKIDFVPGTGSFDTNNDPITPKDELDLGIGNGITEPLIGQIWYNTSDNILYNNELSGWETVFKEVTNALTTHEDRTDLHLGSPQNIFLDALDLPTLLASEVNELIGMGSTQGITTVQGQLDLMVEKAGDTMTGDLKLNGGEHGITNNDGGTGDFNIRIGHEYSGGEIYTQTGGAIKLESIHEAATPHFTISIGNGFSNTIGAPVSFSGVFDFKNDGNISLLPGVTQSDDEHLTTKKYVTDNFVNTTGDVMTSGSDLTFVGGGDVRGLTTGTPETSTSATSRTYVQNIFAPIISPTLSGTPHAPTPTPSTDNTTRIATTAFVQAASTTTTEVSNMIRTSAEARFLGYPGWDQFLTADICEVSEEAYFNFYALDGNDILGTRGVWGDLYFMNRHTVRVSGGGYSSDTFDEQYFRADNFTPLAKITNYTSSAITYQVEFTYWFAHDDTGYYRVLENSTNIKQASLNPANRCFLFNRTSYLTATISRSIPAGSTYTYKLQGYLSGGYALGGDALLPRSINYNRIIF